MQTVAVYLIVACAAAYAGWRIYKMLNRPASPCDGCDGCSLRNEMKRKCEEKRKNTQKDLVG